MGKTVSTGRLPITDANVPVNSSRKANLFDNNLVTYWNNDGNIANAWFAVSLEASSEISQLRLAPRIDRAYNFDVYVDDILIGQYTTASTPSVELQTFDLPADTIGKVVRIQCTSHNWFKVHEVEIVGSNP